MDGGELTHLQRRWRESGDAEDEAAYLRELVRSGALPKERVEISAALGHLPSQRVMAVSPGWQGRLAGLLLGEVPEGTVEAARFRLLLRRSLGELYDECWNRVTVALARSTYLQEFSCETEHVERADLLEEIAVAEESIAAGDGGGEAAKPLWEASEVSHLSTAPLLADLIPWLLGYGDPLRDRVERRQSADS